MKVKIYSTPTCIYCKTLKEYLTRNSITFEEVDVSENEAELSNMIKISGQMGVPVVEINEEVIVGFDKEKVDKALGLK